MQVRISKTMSDCRPIVYTTLPQHNRLDAEHTAGECLHSTVEIGVLWV